MAMKHRYESGALRYLYDRFVGDAPARQAEYEESIANARVAFQLYELRRKARLTQAQLAKKVGTSVSAISRLEDADYEGHSLAMLRRIAAALNQEIEIRFVPRRRPGQAPRRRPPKRKAVA